VADEGTALALAKDASAAQCDRALLVALYPAQPTVDREHIRLAALEHHGVLVDVAASVQELVARVALLSDLPLPEFSTRLQERVLRRLEEHGLPRATVE